MIRVNQLRSRVKATTTAPSPIIAPERIKAERDTQAKLTDRAVRQAMLEAGVLGGELSKAEIEKIKFRTEQKVNEQIRKASGPSREERRRLKQIRNGQLKGPAVSTEARYAAAGLVPGTNLRTMAEPGEVL